MVILTKPPLDLWRRRYEPSTKLTRHEGSINKCDGLGITAQHVQGLRCRPGAPSSILPFGLKYILVKAFTSHTVCWKQTRDFCEVAQLS